MVYRVRPTHNEVLHAKKNDGKLPDRFHERKAKHRTNQTLLESVDKGNLTGRARDKAVFSVKRANTPWTFVGLDGEGITTQHNQHLYNLMIGCSANGEPRSLQPNAASVSTLEAFYWLTEPLPFRTRFVTYSFGYDLTKILEDLDPELVYKLFRPDSRAYLHPKTGQIERHPVVVRGLHHPKSKLHTLTFFLDWLNGRFKIKRIEVLKDEHADPLTREKHHQWVTVFDIWKFFGGAFVNALEAWKVPRALSKTERVAVHKRMREMKARRGDFVNEDPEAIRQYCIDECRYLAELCTLLVKSHDEAGIPLSPNSLFGAGSSGGAMLKAMGMGKVSKDDPGYLAKAQALTLEYPPELNDAIKRAFFGGRFENSLLGIVKAPIHTYDISSAYPYQCCFLPDLLTGRWELTRDRHAIERANAAVVHYRLHKSGKPKPWAPFPYRFGQGHEQGSITFPAHGSEGWVWRDEYLQGERGWSGVEFVEAWVYNTDSDFLPLSRMSEFYRRRLEVGKEGVGLTLKLGSNSVFGKLAQMIGGRFGAYTNWIWAGMTTSGCRAQQLEIMNLHNDLNNLFMVATDGIATAEKLIMPVPRDTGTFDCLNEHGEFADKPLGGWEYKKVEKDMAFVRPGIYFPLEPTADEIEKMRARGVGRATMSKHWRDVVHAIKRDENECAIGSVTRFVGAKTGIYKFGGGRAKRSDEYGRWVNMPITISFDPSPKRASVGFWDGQSRKLGLRVLRNAPVSAPYEKGINLAEALAHTQNRDIIEEQPDLDYLDGMLDPMDAEYYT